MSSGKKKKKEEDVTDGIRKGKDETIPAPPSKATVTRQVTDSMKIYQSSSMKDLWLESEEIKAHWDIRRDVKAHYKIEDDPFAFGATSAVFLCTHLGSGKQYAMKEIDKRRMFSRQRHRCNPAERMKQEILNTAKLSHPHLVNVLDVFETNETIFVAMELLQGGELFNYVIEKNSLQESQAAAILRQVTHAIAYMHDRGYVHRDLKAENILIRDKMKGDSDDSDPFIKVVDFGMSKHVKFETTNSVLGTPGYQAPECRKGQEYTAAVDCFSLGALAYILLCGYMPLYTHEGTEKQTLVFPDSEWSEISDSAKAFVRKLLEYDPQRRMSSSEALKHTWLRAVSTQRVGGKSLTKSQSSATLHSATFLKSGLNRSQQLHRIQSAATSPKSSSVE